MRWRQAGCIELIFSEFAVQSYATVILLHNKVRPSAALSLALP